MLILENVPTIVTMRMLFMFLKHSRIENSLLLNQEIGYAVMAANGFNQK